MVSRLYFAAIDASTFQSVLLLLPYSELQSTPRCVMMWLIRVLSSARFWTIVGALAAVAGALVASWQILAAAELNRRTLAATAALEVHEKAVEMVARITQHYFAEKSAQKPGADNVSNIHPEIRLSYIRLDGAVARAIIVDDEDIQVCMRAIEEFGSTVLESVIPANGDLSTEGSVIALNGLPEMVSVYLSGTEMPANLLSGEDEFGNKTCPFMLGVLEN